ncbi:MAG: hypothetical protein U0807_10505 [Candidatus Binatia bacterium]
MPISRGGVSSNSLPVSTARTLELPLPLREGLDETLTLQQLGVSSALYRTLRSTNAIENLNGLVGHFVRNVRRWRDGHMLVRWIAAGLEEARRSFRRVRGYTDIPKLIAALDRRTLDTKKEVA